MAEVRAAVDDIDRELVALLAERMRFMEAAARIKPLRAAVRDEARKRQVIANARAEAEAQGLDPEVIEELWERLVEASIAHEFRVWDALRANDAASLDSSIPGQWRE
ncbi:chorismate mutase [Thermaurantiacus sp.]